MFPDLSGDAPHLTGNYLFVERHADVWEELKCGSRGIGLNKLSSQCSTQVLLNLWTSTQGDVSQINPGWWFQPLGKILYSQLGLLFPILKIKNVRNHQSVMVDTF